MRHIATKRHTCRTGARGSTSSFSHVPLSRRRDCCRFYIIKDKWLGLCSYCNNAGGQRALCNIPTNTHSWKTPQQANPGFMCAREVVAVFKVQLGARNGVRAKGYEFRIVKLASKAGKYSALMRAACAKIDMKPVWYVSLFVSLSLSLSLYSLARLPCMLTVAAVVTLQRPPELLPQR